MPFDDNNDPLGILTKKAASQNADPLGILQQPKTNQYGIPMADPSEIQSIISKKNQELSNQPIQEEGQAIYSQMAKRDDAIHNTIERNNQLQNKPVDKTSPEYQQQFDNLLSQEKNHDVKVVDAKDGKPFVVPTSGFWENAGKSFVQSLKAPVEAIKQIGMDNKELSDYFENKKKNEPYLPESVPSPIGELGQTLGGLPKTVGELAIPVVGEALAATETELSSTGQHTEALYNRRLQELKDAKGDQNYEPTPQEKEQIAGKARLDAPLAAAPDAAMILVLNKMGGDAPALNKSAETFSQSLSKYGQGVGKLAALGGASEGVRSGIMALQGYHVTPQEALDKSVEGATTWGLMDAMFKVAPLISKLPKAAQAAWKDYMTQVPKPVFEEKVSQMGDEGQQVKEDVSKFDEAKNIVHPKDEEPITQNESETPINEQKNPTTAEPINTATEEKPKEESPEVIQPKGVEGNQPSNEPQPSEEIGVAETKPIEPTQEPTESQPTEKVEPEQKPEKQKDNSVVHAQNIKDKFRQQFKAKGVSDEHIDGAIALMDARANSAVSNGEVKTPEEWYQRIADVKNGEFENSDIKYQKGGLKATIAGVMSMVGSHTSDAGKDVGHFVDRKATEKVSTEIPDEDYLKTIKVSDNREVDATSGKPVTDKNQLNSTANVGTARQIIRAANKYDVDPYTMLAIAFQETGIAGAGETEGNPLHLIDNRAYDLIDEGAKLFKEKMKIADSRGKKTDEERIQAFNGYGKVGKHTEGQQKSLYGIDVSKEPIDMNKNPVYGKRIVDIRDNIIKKNPELVKLVESEKGNVAFQEQKGIKRGALETLKDGRVVIHALEKPDFSTMAHEIAHVFEKDLTEAEKKVMGDSETFARGFERYLRDGKAPSEQLKTLFDKFKDWLTNIYKSLKGSPIEKKVSPELKQVFDRLLSEKQKDNSVVVYRGGSNDKDYLYTSENEQYSKDISGKKNVESFKINPKNVFDLSENSFNSGTIDDFISGLKNKGIRLTDKQIADIKNESSKGEKNSPMYSFLNRSDTAKKAIKDSGYDAVKQKEGYSSDDTVNSYLILDKGIIETEKQKDNSVVGEEKIETENQPAITEDVALPKEETPPAEPPKEPPVEVATDRAGNNLVGVSHAALTDLSNRLGLKEPERMDYLPPEWYADRGRKLLEAGADPDEVNNPNNELHDRISIARAHLEDLTKDADEIGKSKGLGTQEYKDAVKKADDYSKDVVKKLGSKAHQAFVALQGQRDIDTGSFTSVRRAVEETTGKPIDKAQEQKIKELTTQNETLKKQAADLEKQLIEATDKNIKGNGEKKTYTEKAKAVADRFRKLKSKPFTFKDENGNEITPEIQGITWNDLVELGAKAIEKTGEIADGISAILDKVKDADWYAKLSDKDKQKFQDQLQEHFEGTAEETGELESLQEQFADKKGNKFSVDEAKDIWDYAKKNYLDKGIPYRDMISQVSNDLGLSMRQVYEAITSPKVKRISDEMWKKQAQARRSQTKAKTWIEEQNQSLPEKALKKVSGAFRGAAVFGHGGIFIGTHAAPTLFQPSTWSKTIPAFFRAWRYAYGNEAAYERGINELTHRENFLTAQRAGLKNDPLEIKSDEYSKNQTVFGKLGNAGTKGFNAIKVLRQDLFDYHFEKLSEAEKQDPSVAKSIAQLTNNATGASNLNIPDWVNEVSFAGGMEASRWGRLTRNPAKATSTAIRAIFSPDKVSASDKVFAKVWASRVGQQLATYGSLLWANSAIQNTINPKNKVNLSDPTKSDWLKFKFGDTTLDMTSGMLSVIDFISALVNDSIKSKKERRGDTVLQADAKNAGSYLRGKLSPFYSTGVDIKTGTDFFGNPLPYNNEKPATGKHKLTWGEYAWEKSPIPVAEAAKIAYQSAQDNGMSPTAWSNMLDGIYHGAISGSTGFRIGETKERPTLFTDADKKDPTFKYFIDKGMSLPEVADHNVSIKDKKTYTEKDLTEYPKETQQKFDDTHKVFLKQELQKVKSKGYVYTNGYKDKDGNMKISTAYPSGDKKVPLSKLNTAELAEVLHFAQTEATKKTKIKIFGTD